MIPLGKGAQRRVDDCWLSRYACYLIVRVGGRQPSPLEVAPTEPRQPRGARNRYDTVMVKV